MPRGQAAGRDDLLSICDGHQNLSVAQAAALLHTTQNAIYLLAASKKLHPVRAKGVLLFARTDLERHRAAELELEVTRKLQQGVHPLDIYLEADGRVAMSLVDRVMREWCKLTGVWIVEAPRGSYARWLERMKLRAVSPRSLRRLIEALLTDAQVDARARSYMLDQRALNGQGENAKVREQSRVARRSELAPLPEEPSAT